MAESAAQLFSRLGAKECLGDLGLSLFSHLHLGLKPGDVVELCGTEGTGKTEVLLNIAAHCILPKSWKGRRFPGRSTEVIYISTDYKFDLLRLVSLLEGKICQGFQQNSVETPSEDSGDYKKVITSCLARAHILYCNSSSELITTLQSMKSILHNHPEVCVLILDNIASFYWVDRCESGSAGITAMAERRQQQWVGALNDLIQEHHLVVFAAKPLLFGRSISKDKKSHSSSKTPSNSCEEFMSRQWQRLVRYRFHLQKTQEYQTTAAPVTSSEATTSIQHAKMFGVFLAHQIHPSGPVYRFVIGQNGMEFMS